MLWVHWAVKAFNEHKMLPNSVQCQAERVKSAHQVPCRILYSYIIPISLFVTMEIIKYILVRHPSHLHLRNAVCGHIILCRWALLARACIIAMDGCIEIWEMLSLHCSLPFSSPLTPRCVIGSGTELLPLYNISLISQSEDEVPYCCKLNKHLSVISGCLHARS